MNILCKLGLHSKVVYTDFFPSIDSEIVEQVTTTIKCTRCKKVLSKDTWYDETNHSGR